MNYPKAKLTKEEQKAVLLKNHIASEKIHNLVVKIISWRFGILEGASIIDSNKITQKEWDKYRKHILSISKVESAERVKEKLKETQASIQQNGGFE